LHRPKRDRDLNSFPLEELEETPGRHRTTVCGWRLSSKT